MLNSLTSFLARISPELGSLNGIPLLVFVLVLALTLFFFLGYLIQGSRVGWQLRSAVRKITALKSSGRLAVPADVAAVLRWEPMSHLWDEYQDTLHELTRASGGGMSLTEVRATVPAEVFFTRDVLVDGRLFDDFTRHLPGVLTGLGIIGTFAGLLAGLGTFNPSSTASAVAGLTPLMTGVKHAFWASSAAISCAMLVTFISKLVLAYFYRLVEKLNQVIDSLYHTGAGEEYLSRLVHASEKSEAHAAQLKEALVEDLSKMMTNLVDRQIAAQSEATRQLGDSIGSALTNTLAEPIKRMTDAMDKTSQGNGDAVSGMLESMIAGFMSKLDETFGGQMRGVNDQIQKSMDVMTSVQQSLQQLLADIAKTNETTANQMGGKLEDAMKQAAANQETLTTQLREFVTEFRKLVTDEQTKSKQVLDDSIASVLVNVTAAVDKLEEHRRISAHAEEARGVQLADKTNGLIGGLSGTVETLLLSVAEQVQKTQANIDALGTVSTRAIDGMNQGASTMGSAAQRFETAGGAVSKVFETSSGVASQLTTVADTLQLASSALRQGFDKYDATRNVVDTQVAVLKGLVELAHKEAGLSKQVVTDLEVVVKQLKEVERQGVDNLKDISKVLADCFENFGNSLSKQTQRSIGETDVHLGKGVTVLTGVVQELASALSRLKAA